MINPAIVQPSQQMKKRQQKLDPLPPSNLTILYPCPTLLTCYSCAQKKEIEIWLWWIFKMTNEKNPAMFCHRVNNVNKKWEQLWTNDMKVVWNMLKNESHRIEIKHILQKKESLVSSVLSSFYSRMQKSIENWSVLGWG